MKNKFASRLAQMRKRSGMSQKAAAAKLGISQALLSHYEKGIRECGLDFVLKASKVFEVPCDYLLGATDKLPIDTVDNSERNENLIRKPKLYLGRNRLQNAIDLLYNITARFGNPKMHQDINNLFYADVYLTFRIFQNSLAATGETDLFDLPFDSAVLHAQALKAMSCERLIAKMGEAEEKADFTKSQLRGEYPANADAIFSMIESVENSK